MIAVFGKRARSAISHSISRAQASCVHRQSRSLVSSPHAEPSRLALLNGLVRLGRVQSGRDAERGG
jgi:flagellar biosynthesis/type III secretory pathway ATPase